MLENYSESQGRIEIITKVNFTKKDLTWFGYSETWDSGLEKYIHQIYLLLKNGMPISGCTICEFDGCRFIFNLYTDKGERNRGYATKIIQKVCEDSKEYLVLARSVNPEVIALFKSCGFKMLYRNSSCCEILGNTTYA